MIKGIGKRLKTLRKEKKLTLDSLSDIVNKKYNASFSKSAISMWENETREINRKNTSIYCDFFNVTMDWILGLSPNRNSNITESIDPYYVDTSMLNDKQLMELDTLLTFNVAMLKKSGELTENDEKTIKKAITEAFINTLPKKE